MFSFNWRFAKWDSSIIEHNYIHFSMPSGYAGLGTPVTTNHLTDLADFITYNTSGIIALFFLSPAMIWIGQGTGYCRWAALQAWYLSCYLTLFFWNRKIWNLWEKVLIIHFSFYAEIDGTLLKCNSRAELIRVLIKIPL